MRLISLMIGVLMVTKLMPHGEELISAQADINFHGYLPMQKEE